MNKCHLARHCGKIVSPGTSELFRKCGKVALELLFQSCSWTFGSFLEVGAHSERLLETIIDRKNAPISSKEFDPFYAH